HGVEYFKRALDITRRRADLVIVPSQATAEDCASAGIGRERIRVIPHGVRSTPVGERAAQHFRSAHRLSRPYVLWVGTREPRKNLPALLKAYEEVARISDLDLVLVGPEGWGDDAEERELLRVLPTGRVHVLGRLEDRDLDAAYACARVFCFPSSWEGFGLPVLEAMAHGVPVVTSKGTSMEEVAGPVANLVDPGSPPEISAAILEAAGQQHDERASQGRVRSQEFTWSRCARAHARVYQELLA
ncbi:MAG: glycosyltransferase family 4 protein, partial [Pauljensenia sp.]